MKPWCNSRLHHLSASYWGIPCARQSPLPLLFLPLCSRAAIEGGVNPSVAYTLNNYYMQMTEDCATVAEISAVTEFVT